MFTVAGNSATVVVHSHYKTFATVCLCVCMFQLPVEAAYLYDAVWIYARAANAVVAEGYDPSDGRRILNNIRRTTYEST